MSKVRSLSGAPSLDSPAIQPSDSGVFYFYAKPLVVKGFAKAPPSLRILRREPLPGGRAHDFNEKRPKFSGRLEQATSPGRSRRIDLTKSTPPVWRPPGPTSYAREKSGGRLFITAIEITNYDFSSTGHRFVATKCRLRFTLKIPWSPSSFFIFPS